jgi:hypothetical protein
MYLIITILNFINVIVILTASLVILFSNRFIRCESFDLKILCSFTHRPPFPLSPYSSLWRGQTNNHYSSGSANSESFTFPNMMQESYLFLNHDIQWEYCEIGDQERKICLLILYVRNYTHNSEAKLYFLFEKYLFTCSCRSRQLNE